MNISKALRDIILERDSYTCVLCDRAATDCHHITRRSQGGKDHPYNLVALCRVHHDIVHGAHYPDAHNFFTPDEARQAVTEYIQDYYAAHVERGLFRGGGW